MTKQELINSVAKRTGVERVATEVIIDEAIAQVQDAISHGEPVYIRGLFSLTIKKRAEKVARDIKKGVNIVVPAHHVPVAKFSKELVEKVKANVKDE